MTLPEIRRFLWRLWLARIHSTQDTYAWSHWRRHHQANAKYYHYKRRSRLPEQLQL